MPFRAECSGHFRGTTHARNLRPKCDAPELNIRGQRARWDDILNDTYLVHAGAAPTSYISVLRRYARVGVSHKTAHYRSSSQSAQDELQQLRAAQKCVIARAVVCRHRRAAFAFKPTDTLNWGVKSCTATWHFYPAYIAHPRPWRSTPKTLHNFDANDAAALAHSLPASFVWPLRIHL